MFEVDSQLMVSTHCWNNFSQHPKFLHPIKHRYRVRQRETKAQGLRALLLKSAAMESPTREEFGGALRAFDGEALLHPLQEIPDTNAPA